MIMDIEVINTGTVTVPKLAKEGKPKFISICNRSEFLVESKETK